MNKYKKWYKAITESTNDREGYTERHHIIPRSLGGGEESENLIRLTAREHFICHWLLSKMYEKGSPERASMIFALRMMRSDNTGKRYKTKITSRVYENLKVEYSAIASKRFTGKGNGFYNGKHTDDAKQRISKANTGDKNGSKQPLARKKISESKKGKTRPSFSKEWTDNMSKAHSGENNSMFGRKQSESAKQLIREKATGRTQSAETIKKKADAIRGSKRKKKLCPHCQREIAVNGYARWHGQNCKMKGRKK